MLKPGIADALHLRALHFGALHAVDTADLPADFRAEAVGLFVVFGFDHHFEVNVNPLHVG